MSFAGVVSHYARGYVSPPRPIVLGMLFFVLYRDAMSNALLDRIASNLISVPFLYYTTWEQVDHLLWTSWKSYYSLHTSAPTALVSHIILYPIPKPANQYLISESTTKNQMRNWIHYLYSLHSPFDATYGHQWINNHSYKPLDFHFHLHLDPRVGVLATTPTSLLLPTFVSSPPLPNKKLPVMAALPVFTNNPNTTPPTIIDFICLRIRVHKSSAYEDEER